jgi:hypothetical protein
MQLLGLGHLKNPIGNQTRELYLFYRFLFAIKIIYTNTNASVVSSKDHNSENSCLSLDCAETTFLLLC